MPTFEVRYLVVPFRRRLMRWGGLDIKYEIVKKKLTSGIFKCVIESLNH